jgi:hypothetical protein
MSTYTPPALNDVDFGLTATTPASIANATSALSSYSVPSLTAVAFALVAYTAPTFVGIDFELGDAVFPTQYSGLRVRGASATLDLCLVATADAPSGDTPRIRKGATTYAVYLVDTTDPQASPVRITTGAGVKAIRLKT